MSVYLDSSAVVKLAVREAESDALRHHLAGLGAEPLVSSALVRVEVVRAVRHAGPAAVDAVRRATGSLHLVPLDRTLLDEAAEIDPAVIRSLDAVHLASVKRVGATLRHVVTYDTRMRTAAQHLGLATVVPT